MSKLQSVCIFAPLLQFNDSLFVTVKVCEKRHILREKKQKAIMREKQIMNILNNHCSPFFIKLHCTFQDTDRLCILFNGVVHFSVLLLLLYLFMIQYELNVNVMKNFCW